MNTTKLINAADPRAIDEAAAIICRGGLVAFPTETVYGLGADACNPLAVARVFEVKERPWIDPIIVHVADPESAHLYGQFPEPATALMCRFWPGPLTLVVPKTDMVPPIVTAGLNTVAIRMPAHPAALALIRAASRAIAAPSANVFGHVSPTEAHHVAAQLSDRIELILDGGRCAVGVESTVLSLAESVPRILRVGGVPPEALRDVLGALAYSTETKGRPEAPGQLLRHYATRTPLEIVEEDDRRAEPCPGERVGLLAWTAPKGAERYTAVEVLSPSGDLREAAANLFAALHRLDGLQLERLVAYPVPEQGLGIAIMDRLRRCSAR
jgi:L-threonylcarbamoyladenylate synthase